MLSLPKCTKIVGGCLRDSAGEAHDTVNSKTEQYSDMQGYLFLFFSLIFVHKLISILRPAFATSSARRIQLSNDVFNCRQLNTVEYSRIQLNSTVAS